MSNNDNAVRGEESASAIQGAAQEPHDDDNPLWVVAAGMAFLFAALASVLALT
jgi:hypothetical protein